MSPTRLLVTRGMSWRNARDWRILQMTTEPHLATCSKLAQLSACLTPHEAARVARRAFPAAQVFMWDQPDWIPTRSTHGHQAVRVVGDLVTWSALPGTAPLVIVEASR